jgi:hypothetical protein
MHLSFDLYPSYLRDFTESMQATAAYSLHYDIHAMRNYEYRNEGGKRVGPFPQVRKEGSLQLSCQKPASGSSIRSMNVSHIRSWATWTNQEHASKQTIEGSIDYAANSVGSPGNWIFSYRSDPILPVKSFRLNKLDPIEHSGTRSGDQIRIQTGANFTTRKYTANHPATTLYTLIERLHAGAVNAGLVDYLDDLSMFRPGLEITPLPKQKMEIENRVQELHGFALVGPALLPLYFWQNEHNHVLAVIGRNVAYTLTEIQNEAVS